MATTRKLTAIIEVKVEPCASKLDDHQKIHDSVAEAIQHCLNYGHGEGYVHLLDNEIALTMRVAAVEEAEDNDDEEDGEPGILEKHDLKQLERRVARLREKLDLPPAAFPYPTEGYEARLFRHNAFRCPFCTSDSISNAGDWDGGPYDLSCKVECDSCGACWTEIYHLKGACNFEGEDEG